MKMCMKELGMHNYYAEIELEIQNSTKVHLSQLLGKPLSNKGAPVFMLSICICVCRKYKMLT